MNLAIVLTHNKSNQGNIAQIEALVPEVEQQIEGESFYYTIKSLPGHRVKFYQIVPYGVTPPSNMYDLDSYNVIYGEGDEDKIGDHARFYNWGLKRAADHGADVVIHLDNLKKVNWQDIASKLNATDKKIETVYGKLSKADAVQIPE